MAQPRAMQLQEINEVREVDHTIDRTARRRPKRQASPHQGRRGQSAGQPQEQGGVASAARLRHVPL